MCFRQSGSFSSIRTDKEYEAMISLNEIQSVNPSVLGLGIVAGPSSHSSQFERDQSVGNHFRIYLVHEDFFIPRELVRTIAYWHSRWEH